MRKIYYFFSLLLVAMFSTGTAAAAALDDPSTQPLRAYFVLPSTGISDWTAGNGYNGCMFGVDLHGDLSAVVDVPFKLDEEIDGLAGTLAGNTYYAVLSQESQTGYYPTVTLNSLNCATGENTLVCDLTDLAKNAEVRDLAYDATTGKLYALVDDYDVRAIYDINLLDGTLTKVFSGSESDTWRAMAIKDGTIYLLGTSKISGDYYNVNVVVSTVDLATSAVTSVISAEEALKAKIFGTCASAEFHDGLLYLATGKHVYTVDLTAKAIRQLTSETQLPKEGAGICFALSKENPLVPNADMLAALETAKVALNTQNPGYPTVESEAYKTFAAAVAAAEAAVYTATEDEITALSNALTAYKSATDGIQLPEGGKYYSITSVSKDGREYYLNYVANTEVVLAKRDADEELPATAIFECVANEDGTFSFKTNDGNFLVYHNQLTSTNPHTGFATAEGGMTKITLEKLSNSSANVVADSQADLFGLLAWKSLRSTTATDNGYMVIKYGDKGTPLETPVYDGASAPFFNGNFSSAFRVEEQSVASRLVSVDPAEDHFTDGMPTTIKLTFNTPVTVEMAILQYGMGQEANLEDKNAVVEGTTLTLTLPEELKYESMAMIVLQVRGSDGEYITYSNSSDMQQEDMIFLTYTAEVPSNVFNCTAVTPEEGVVGSLSELQLTMNNPIFRNIDLVEETIGGVDASKTVVVKNEAGETVTTGTVTFKDLVATITLAEAVTATGDYTVTVPEATIYNSAYDADAADFGVASGAVYNPELTFSYQIAAPATVEVNPAPGEYEEGLPTTITLTCSKEIQEVSSILVRTTSNPRGVTLGEENYTVEGNVLTLNLESLVDGNANLALQIRATDADGQAITYGEAEGFIVLEYATVLPADRFTLESASPAEGNITADKLDVIELTFVNEADDSDWIGGIDESKEVVLKNAEGKVVTTATLAIKMDDAGWETNVLIVTLAEDVATDGTYTLVVPAGTVYNSMYDDMFDDFGVAYGAIYNPEVTVTYEFKSTGIGSVSADSKKAGIYAVGGQKVNETDVKKLERGIYIVNGKKVVVK